jgi:hypothetical protein
MVAIARGTGDDLQIDFASGGRQSSQTPSWFRRNRLFRRTIAVSVAQHKVPSSKERMGSANAKILEAKSMSKHGFGHVLALAALLAVILPSRVTIGKDINANTASQAGTLARQRLSFRAR